MDWISYLLGLGTGLIGWFVGLVTSTFLQDREHYRRQRGIVGVLIAEVERMRMELGNAERWSDSSMYGGRAAIPEVHPWVHSSVVAVAESDPSILRRFLKLERFLQNQQVFVETLRHSRRQFGDATVAQQQQEASEPDSDAIADIARSVAEGMRRKDEVEAAALNSREVEASVQANHADIIDQLSSLRASLVALDQLLSREPAFHARRLLDVRVVLLRDETLDKR